jgi:hypothetical protein
VLETYLTVVVEQLQLDLVLQLMVAEEEDIILIVLDLVEQGMAQAEEEVILLVLAAHIIISMMALTATSDMKGVLVAHKAVVVVEEQELLVQEEMQELVEITSTEQVQM